MITTEEKNDERSKALRLLVKCKERERKLKLVTVKADDKTVYLMPKDANHKKRLAEKLAKENGFRNRNNNKNQSNEQSTRMGKKGSRY